MFLGLIKPQFESRHEETQKGVVVDEAVRQRVISEVTSALEDAGFMVKGVVQSPIKGPEGNIDPNWHSQQHSKKSCRQYQ